jgi:hypothetical protein
MIYAHDFLLIYRMKVRGGRDGVARAPGGDAALPRGGRPRRESASLSIVI